VAIVAALTRPAKGGIVPQSAQWAVVAIGMLLAIRTGSRGQVLASIVCIGLFLPMAKPSVRLGRWLPILCGLVVFVSLTYWLMATFATHGRWHSMESSLAMRQQMWSDLLDYWWKSDFTSWMLGLGSCASRVIIGPYPHNIPLEILCEEGLLGVVIYVGFLSCVARSCFSNGWASDAGKRNVMITFVALFCFEIILTLKSGSLFGQQLFLCYGIVIQRLCKVEARVRTQELRGDTSKAAARTHFPSSRGTKSGLASALPRRSHDS
jgi:O-antigen ligase